MRKKEMEVLANLKSIVILDCDKDAFYKKVQSASGLYGLYANIACNNALNVLLTCLFVLY